jgi:hypothetical protein
MTETNISPVEDAWKLADGLKDWIYGFISTVNLLKKQAEHINDWAEYHRCVGKIEAYENILHILRDVNIKQKE